MAKIKQIKILNI